jgi:hypothetical protein
MGEQLQTAGRLRVPALKNLTPGEPLAPFLMSRPLIHRLSDAQNSLDGAWIGKFLEQLGEVLEKATRIHFKSLGGILALQEGIMERWTALHAAPETSQADPASMEGP